MKKPSLCIVMNAPIPYTHGFWFNFSTASGTIVENPTAQTHIEKHEYTLTKNPRTGAVANQNDLEALWL